MKPKPFRQKGWAVVTNGDWWYVDEFEKALSHHTGRVFQVRISEIRKKTKNQKPPKTRRRK